MINGSNYIVFQAYGSIEILAECRFALMQLYKYNPADEFSIVLYTDNAAYFKNELPLFSETIIEPVTPGIIKDWRGEINFVHRVKIKMLQDFFTKYSGNVLYCDTDTNCLQSLKTVFDDIANGNVYMHTNEGPVSNRNSIESARWKKFLESPVCKNDLQLTGIDDSPMWNAGVIGMNSSQAFILDKVLSLTDTIYKHFPRHTVEQFAFSYLLQQQFTIKAAEDFLFHYWYLKEYRILLEQFFTASANYTLDEQLTLLQDVMPQQITADKMSFKKMSFIKKLFAKKWSIDQYSAPLLSRINQPHE